MNSTDNYDLYGLTNEVDAMVQAVRRASSDRVLRRLATHVEGILLRKKLRVLTNTKKGCCHPGSWVGLALPSGLTLLPELICKSGF